MSNIANPAQRITEEEMNDLQVVVPTSLPDDTKAAMIANFPPEQCPIWSVVAGKIEQGWIQLHELRSRSTGELLSARLMVDYPGRNRGECQFLLASFVVTPDSGSRPDTKQSKSKGYGSLLRQKSLDMSRRQRPHALGIVAERESPAGASSKDDQRVKRASWMSRIGLFAVDGYEYEIPPIVLTADESITGVHPDQEKVAAERRLHSKPADLLIFRFDGGRKVSGKDLKSIVERLYLFGYGVKAGEEYFNERISAIDVDKDYDLVEA